MRVKYLVSVTFREAYKAQLELHKKHKKLAKERLKADAEEAAAAAKEAVIRKRSLIFRGLLWVTLIIIELFSLKVILHRQAPFLSVSRLTASFTVGAPPHWMDLRNDLGS